MQVSSPGSVTSVLSPSAKPSVSSVAASAIRASEKLRMAGSATMRMPASSPVPGSTGLGFSGSVVSPGFSGAVGFGFSGSTGVSGTSTSSPSLYWRPPLRLVFSTQ